MFHDEGVLRHVHAAHVFGQSGGSRLHLAEVIGRLHAVAQWQRIVDVVVGGLGDHADELFDAEFPQDLTSPLGLPHVHPDQPGVGFVDLGQDFAAFEVDHVHLLHALVRLTPANDRNLDHGLVLGLDVPGWGTDLEFE